MKLTTKKIVIINIESFLAAFLIYLLFFKLATNKLPYFNMNIHPLAILVAIQSMRWGTINSLPTVLYASFFYFLPFYELNYDVVLFFSAYKYYKFILMFLFINLTLGRQRDKQDFKLLFLKDAREKDLEELQEFERANRDYENITKILGSRIIESRESIVTLHQMEKKLKNSQGIEILNKGLELVNSYIHCKNLRVYRYEEENKTLVKEFSIGNSIFQDEINEDIFPFDFKESFRNDKIVEFINEYNYSKNYIGALFVKNKIKYFIHIEKLEYEYKDIYQTNVFSLILDKIQEQLDREEIKI